MEWLRQPVSRRVLILSVVIVALMSGGSAVAASSYLLERGPQGPTGPPGERGPEGPAAGVDEGQARAIAEEEAQGAAEAAVEQLDPSPSDLATQVEQVEQDLESLCSSLSLAEALSSEVISCP